MDSDSIVFFDLETTMPSRDGQGRYLLEFGAIKVCPRHLVELASYSTLIRHPDVSSIPHRYDGITFAGAPTFADVADVVYSILHGKVWAGHNIINFDCKRIKEAFAEIGRPAPVPRGTIDSLPSLRQKFGKRAGNMKMETLAAYFGLGQQKHRSLDDVRLNLEVIKHCAAVLFLESSVVGLSAFLGPVEISMADITVTLLSANQYGQRMLLLHRGVALQLYWTELRVHLGCREFHHDARRPKLTMTFRAPARLCKVLVECENIGRQLMFSSGSRSEWRALIKKNWLLSGPIVRLNIPTECLTEVYQKDTDGNFEKLDLSNSYVEKLESLIVPGTTLDTYFDIELYDYEGQAGICLVAKRLDIQS